MIITGLNFLGCKSWNELSEAIEIYKKNMQKGSPGQITFVL